MALFARHSSPTEAQQLARLLNPQDPTVSSTMYLRAQVIVLSQQRTKLPQIAETLTIHRQTVAHWIKCFNRDGLVGLQAMPVRHPPLFVRALTDEEHQRLRAYAQDSTQSDERRVHAEVIMLSAEGRRIKEIAAILTIPEPQVRAWVRRFGQDELLSFTQVVVAGQRAGAAGPDTF